MAGFVDSATLLVAGFIVIGSAVRGIVDYGGGSAEGRVPISLGVAATIAAKGCLYDRDCSRLASRRLVNSAAEHASTRLTDDCAWVCESRPSRMPPLAMLDVHSFALVTWVGVALVFVVGLFLFFLGDGPTPGGDVVVAARSMMELILLTLVCDLAARRALPPIPLVLAYCVVPEVISWALSYVVVPRVLSKMGDDAGGVFVVAVTLSLLSMALVAVGVRLVVTARNVESSPRPSADIVDADGMAADAAPAQNSLEERVRVALLADGLTERETSVCMLHSRGRTLAKVADELGISTSTAQSHIKNAYHKLGVHSRDELVERMGT